MRRHVARIIHEAIVLLRDHAEPDSGLLVRLQREIATALCDASDELPQDAEAGNDLR